MTAGAQLEDLTFMYFMTFTLEYKQITFFSSSAMINGFNNFYKSVFALFPSDTTLSPPPHPTHRATCPFAFLPK